MLKNKNILYIVISLAILDSFSFITILSFLGNNFCNMTLYNTKVAQKNLDYRAGKRKKPIGDAMFGGMPTYQSGSQFK